jgi:membrane protease subunit HflK
MDRDDMGRDERYERYMSEIAAWRKRAGRSGRLIVLAAGGVIMLVVLLMTFYQVEPEEIGVVLRVGKFVRTSEPGLRAKIPFLEEVRKVQVQRQLKQEFGFRTEEAGVRTVFSNADFTGEAVMLTGDLNVAVVEWIVQYRVGDPYKYLFKVRSLTDTFRAMNEAVMREVVGDRTVTEVLTVGRQAIETRVEERLRELSQQYEMGITIEQVVLQDVNPPDPVKPSWDAVNQAQQQRDRMINDARAEYNKVIPRAKGEAQQAILEAEGYAIDRVNRSEGESARFQAVHEAYRRAPEVTRRRLYLETMERVIPTAGGRLFVDKDATGIVPLLNLQGFGSPAAPRAAALPAGSGGGQ